MDYWVGRISSKVKQPSSKRLDNASGEEFERVSAIDYLAKELSTASEFLGMVYKIGITGDKGKKSIGISKVERNRRKVGRILKDYDFGKLNGITEGINENKGISKLDGTIETYLKGEYKSDEKKVGVQDTVLSLFSMVGECDRFKSHYDKKKGPYLSK